MRMLCLVLALLAAPALAGGNHEPPAGVLGSASAGAVATAAGAPVSVTGGAVANEFSSIAFGAPAFSNGALTCEAQLPLIGGTYERESCATLRNAAYVGQLTGDAEAVKAVLCNLPQVRAAFATVGRPCQE
jgi:hypothetical protein